ncbi:MAG: preprotein translocase subunit SecG [Bacteroidia bacterium]
MVTLFSILIIIACILLILVILVQNPKGGGVNSSLSGSTQMMGVRKTADFLEKSTWVLISVIVVLSLLISTMDKPVAAEKESEIKEQIESEPLQDVPQLPTNVPTPEGSNNTPNEDAK